MYIIIGANGFLGSYFIKNILELTDDHILAVARHTGQPWGRRVEWAECDITDKESVEALNSSFFQKNSNNKVLFLAAYHHPDLVEQNPRLAWDTNVTALSRFLNLADNVSRLIYPSTDSVYGDGEPDYRFKENDAFHPVNRYGVQKTVAEKLVTAYGYHVVRFPFLIAPSLLPHKKHFYDIIVASLLEGKPIELFSDSYRSTLNFNTAARLTVELMERETQAPQIVNVCGDKAYSKYDVGLMIAERLCVSRELIVPISIHASENIFKVKRAGSTVMDNTLLRQTLGLDSVSLEL